ncbi:hypothetical protein [Denitrificimonas caeni]|jgi:hypothetical protein|uniref:hypothetical protein n=1 Tax=Denitrificimonas caeni TaxID=521720 RepID=UPI0003B64C24|nr:hypothetical protein [Denitrificimonas caeni]HAB92951.1 hypothetical protein [Pseudomonas sp.]
MKKQVLLKTMAGLGLALSFSLVTLPSMAQDDHDSHDAHNIELQLNAGQKWHTDAPLRQAMRDISLAVNTALDGIHKKELDAAGYQALAGTVNQQVAYMVENCQLEPEADAQLHIVIARLMDSAQVMEKQNDLQVKNEAAVKLVGALNSYADYFEDASFVKPVH